MRILRFLWLCRLAIPPAWIRFRAFSTRIVFSPFLLFALLHSVLCRVTRSASLLMLVVHCSLFLWGRFASRLFIFLACASFCLTCCLVHPLFLLSSLCDTPPYARVLIPSSLLPFPVLYISIFLSFDLSSSPLTFFVAFSVQSCFLFAYARRHLL